MTDIKYLTDEEFKELLEKVNKELALEMAILAPNDTAETFPPPGQKLLEKIWDTPEEDKAWEKL
jgi:hypothetical protein